ncbi:10278_t:CDS:2, partial [Acaulospora colombiana]
MDQIEYLWLTGWNAINWQLLLQILSEILDKMAEPLRRTQVSPVHICSTSITHQAFQLWAREWNKILIRIFTEKLYEEGADIVLMIQADMLAYHSADEPMQLGLPEWFVKSFHLKLWLKISYRIGSPVAALLLSNISSIYVPDLTLTWIGFTATQVFERAGWIIDPHYHSSGDFSNRTNYDLDQVQSIAKYYTPQDLLLMHK